MKLSIWSRIAHNPVRFFAAVSLIAGLTILFLVPPFQVPDEYLHFTRAYEVSGLQIPHRYHEAGVDREGSDLPASILRTYNVTKLFRESKLPDVSQARKLSIHQITASLKIPLDKQSRAFYDTSAVPAYFPLLYVPQAIVIKCLSVINTPIIVMLYATRIVGLLLWIAAGTLVIRILKSTKYDTAMASILLLPMFVAQASASTDPLLNGLTILFLAIIATLVIAKKQVSLTMIIILTAMLSIMTLAKPVYLAFGLLGLLLTTKYKGYRALALRLVCIAIPFAIYAAWILITKNSGPPVYIDSVANGYANPSAQVGYLVPNILNFVEPLVNTVFLGWGDSVAASLIGVFGKLDTPLPVIFVILGYLSAAVAIFAGISKPTEYDQTLQLALSKWKRLVVILVATTFVVGVYLAMYIYSTPPHEKIVTGVQGRYLLPLLPMAVLFMPKNLLLIKQKAYELTLTVLPLVLLTASVLVIFLRYYVVYPQ